MINEKDLLKALRDAESQLFKCYVLATQLAKDDRIPVWFANDLWELHRSFRRVRVKVEEEVSEDGVIVLE